MRVLRLLPVFLLTACAATRDMNITSDPSDDLRIVNTVDVQLDDATRAETGLSLIRQFTGREISGNITAQGPWSISRKVTHTRLRCATYETGIQLGRGDPACSNVEWLTNVNYVTRQIHCNSATLIHTGGGEFAGQPGLFETASCVRVVTRCQGPC